MGLLQHTIAGQANVAGISVPLEIHRASDSQCAFQKQAAPAVAGELTTRSNDDSGVVTLPEGHGLEAGVVVAVFWNGGCYPNLNTSLDGNLLTVTNLAGSEEFAMPAAGTPVVVAPNTSPIAYFGVPLQALVIAATQRAYVYVDAGATSFGVELQAGEEYRWPNGGSPAPVTEENEFIRIYSGDAASPAVVTFSAAF